MQAFATEALGVQTITPNPVSLQTIVEEVMTGAVLGLAGASPAREGRAYVHTRAPSLC